MIRFDIITIFPQIFDSFLKESLLAKAQKKGLLKINVYNLRDWVFDDKHKTVDDRPYGGGLGMVLKVEPVYRAVQSLKSKSKRKNTKVILFTPRGKKFDQKTAYKLAKLDQIIMICGRYEGIDERVAKHIADIRLSMGDYDFVPETLVKNGFRLLFEKIAVKPGKPTVFGISDKAFCFGLPGNPVSTFVIFQIIVKPFLLKLMGHDYTPPAVSMRLAQAVTGKKSNRDSWVPVRRTEKGDVSAIEYHGSAHLNALSSADGLICIPRGVTKIPQGTLIDVRQI